MPLGSRMKETTAEVLAAARRRHPRTLARWVRLRILPAPERWSVGAGCYNLYPSGTAARAAEISDMLEDGTPLRVVAHALSSG